MRSRLTASPKSTVVNGGRFQGTLGARILTLALAVVAVPIVILTAVASAAVLAGIGAVLLLGGLVGVSLRRRRELRSMEGGRENVRVIRNPR